MKLMQKGQSMVEFAVIFPFFMFLIMSLAYFGLAFADYLQLNSIARSTARAAVEVDKTKYNQVKEKYSNNKLISNVYKWENTPNQFDITYDEKNNNVTVKIKATLNKDSDSLPSIIDRLTNSEISKSGTFDINIEYTMYKG